MSYGESIMTMWKDHISEVEKEKKSSSFKKGTRFTLHVKNDHLKYNKVYLVITFYTTAAIIEEDRQIQWMTIGYEIKNKNKKVEVLGRKQHGIDYKDDTYMFGYINGKINQILKQIESLEYDKYFDVFVNTSDKEQAVKHKIQQLLLEESKKKETVPICCVCHDACLLKTPCRHHLCLVCFNNLELIHATKKCPMCRETIFGSVCIRNY